MDDEEISAAASTRSRATTTTSTPLQVEVFQTWATKILSNGEDGYQKNVVPDEARSYFHALSSSSSSDATAITTTINAALAQLVQAMSECIAAHKYAAVLACLTGALHGCFHDDNTSTIDAVVVVVLTGPMVQMLSTFFLEYIGPLSIAIDGENDDGDEDEEDTIRDRALEAIDLVLKLGTNNNKESNNSIFTTAKTAVERRCAVVDDNGLVDYNNSHRRAGGLSLLSRSRRSLCFATLQSAVDHRANNNNNKRIDDNDESSFVLFCVQCLYGESDPRCLLQLLDLLSSVRARYNTTSGGGGDSDTLLSEIDETILEAVSPYYPIQFTPPPNDVHGITRDRLRQAANRILIQLPALHLFLELLEPEVSYSEQLEALEDLDDYLAHNLFHCKVSEMEQLSDCFRRVHTNASSSAAPSNSNNNPDARRVAERVRVIAGTTAAAIEQDDDDDLWRAFVQTPMLRFDVTNAMDAAYLTSLAARGGERTLRLCLDTALPTVTDFYTIAALCSACRAATDRRPMQPPHPLQRHGPKVLSSVCDALEKEITLSALCAFEAATMAVPAHDLSNAWLERIRKILSSFVVTMGNHHIADNVRQGCATTLGTILTKALEGDVTSSSATVLDTDPVRTLLRDEIFPTLIDTVQNATTDEEGTYSRKALSNVTGLKATSRIIQLLMFTLRSAVRNHDAYRRRGIVDTLGGLLQDPAAAMAFQTLEPPNLTVFDILAELLPERHRNASSNLLVSSLTLPQSADEADAIGQEIATAAETIGSFRTAYESVTNEPHALKLIAAVNLVLPPLNSSDAVKLSMLFPLLSALMECDAAGTIDSLTVQFRTMASAFFQECTSTELPDPIREHAARCLHAVIAKFTPRNNEIKTPEFCPARDLIGSHVMPSLTGLFHEIQSSNVKYQQNKKEQFLVRFRESVQMLALLGSAAAIRGGPLSSKTADAVAFFLLDMAVQRPVNTICVDMAEELDIATMFGAYGSSLVDETSVIAAHQFGSLLVAGPANTRSIWKQRLLHLSTKRLQSFGSYNTSSGSLAAVCYLICSGDIQQFDATSIENFGNAILDGLQPRQEETRLSLECRRLHLSALLKLVSLCPSVLGLHLFALVTGLLRVYASADIDIASRLLALRALDQVGNHTSNGMNNNDTSMTAIRPAVIAILQTALNHPSRVLRSAAAKVRNAWCVADV